MHPGENIRVFPISNWTELDVWEYIAGENWKCLTFISPIARDVIRRGNGLLPVSHLIELKEGEEVENLMVRFRTVGDMSCTCPVESIAVSVTEIIAETAITRITERGATRMDDQTRTLRWNCAKKRVASDRIFPDEVRDTAF